MNILRKVVTDYSWIHLSISLAGNAAFAVGSVLFLPAFEAWKTTGVWLFIVGATLMLIGAAGRLMVDLYET